MSIQCNRTVYCMVGSFFFGGGGAGGKGDDWGKKMGAIIVELRLKFRC